MSNPKKNKRILSAIAFLEELGWLLDSARGMKLTELATVLREAIDGPSSAKQVGTAYTSPNPNKHFLIGVLPRLFQDPKLFPNNALIASFAEDILGISVSRHEKRSKYELIGLIVCETDELSDEKLDRLVRALAEITNSDDKLNHIRAASQSDNFSWNNAIYELTKSGETNDS